MVHDIIQFVAIEHSWLIASATMTVLEIIQESVVQVIRIQCTKFFPDHGPLEQVCTPQI